MIVSSGMPKGRDLLVDLIKLDKAWKDGSLEPARAVESKTPEAKLLDLIASGAKPPAVPLTLDEEDDVDAARLRRDARNGVFEQVPFLVDDSRTIRIRYSELARLLGCEIAAVYSVARFHTDWLERVAPLHQRRERGGGWMTYHGEGGLHTATYYTVGQAIAIAVSRGRSDLEVAIVAEIGLFDRIMSDYADRQVAWRQAKEDDDAKMVRAPTLLGASLEGAAILREISAKLDVLSGLAAKSTEPRWWRFWAGPSGAASC